MLLKIFSVYDSKVEAYIQPFYMNSTGAAMRAFEDTVNDPESALNKHPEDYTLFELGTFDDQTAQISLYESKKSLTTAIECRSNKLEAVS